MDSSKNHAAVLTHSQDKKRIVLVEEIRRWDAIIEDVGCGTCPPDNKVAKEVKILRSGGCGMCDVGFRISDFGIQNTAPKASLRESQKSGVRI